ncbi:kinetochore protein SPC24 homolog isoform X1 [Cornus florida]|uniref:kinetochore protein SPC24 homolog isoform X1 n=1 Tax=Cornus florida TaxID=4283 RepID=UPI00289A2CC1|nr:kinetochore protein SPC24 homolog isoform X1 [Cornus florida]
MGEFSRNTDMKELISFSNDLVEVLKNEKDTDDLSQCLGKSEALQSQCDADYSEVQILIQDYHKKIDASKQKTNEAKLGVVPDAEIDFLQKELEEELQRERLLREELRAITDEINDLEHQRVSIEERKQLLKKVEQEELRAQRKLSMYASVTNIIPNLDDQSIISGDLVLLELDELQILLIERKRWLRSLNFTQGRRLPLIHAMAFGR